MKPMLARTYGPRYNQFPCFVQPKLNGVRALHQRGVFQSRDEKLWNGSVLLHLREQLRQCADIIGDSILDGELYVHGWKLQRINGAVAVNRLEPNEDTLKVEYHIFDIVDPKKTFFERFYDFGNQLTEANLSHIKAVQTDYIQNRSLMDLIFNAYTGVGYEGIMLRPSGPYEFGEHFSTRTQAMTEHRSRYLWKHKLWQDAEYLCVGITYGQGKASIGIGALQFQPLNPLQRWQTPCEVGTGFSDEERIEYMTNPPLAKTIKVRFLNLTNDLKPFNPSFICTLP